MLYNVYFYVLSVVCLLSYQDFARGEINHETTDNLLQKYSVLCDNSYIEAQMETLRLQMELMQQQLNKQENLFNSMDKNINELPLKMQAMQEKLLQDNKIIFEDLKNTLNEQIQNQVRAAVQPPVDDKIFILSDIKEMLKDHDKALNNLVSSQNQNQNHTQSLAYTISNKLVILEKMDNKLVTIENVSRDQSKLRCDIQRYLDKNEVIKNTCKPDYHNLFCNSGSYPTNCANFRESHCVDKKCCIRNQMYGAAAFIVSCNKSDEDGAWTVIQRRIDGSVDFYRNWSEYKNGFGDVDGEFFIGLDKLHALTATFKPMELLIQLEDFDNVMKYAKYDDFQVGNEMENYKLIKVGSYTGNAGDSFSQHVGCKFSTKDRDNDESDKGNCATWYTGAWWYKKCHHSNLNGRYHMKGVKPSYGQGICWDTFHSDLYSMKFVQMMIRPKRL